MSDRTFVQITYAALPYYVNTTARFDPDIIETDFSNIYKEVEKMTGMNGVSAYQQINTTLQAINMGSDRRGVKNPSRTETSHVGESSASKPETSAWSPIDTSSSLLPRKTEYGNTIGNVQLSDQAKAYYDKLKAKFQNMDFIAVSKDMKAQVQQNVAAYGNASKMVVLIDEEKLERMATDESYRKKYEGIIAMSQNKLGELKNSLASNGASVKSFGMSVDSNGNTSFFATVEKSLDLQKKRIEKKAAEKKEEKAKEKKKAEREEKEERIRKAVEKKTEKETDKGTEKEYVSFEAKSAEELLASVRAYTYEDASRHVMTDFERMLGGQVDYKG